MENAQLTSIDQKLDKLLNRVGVPRSEPAKYFTVKDATTMLRLSPSTLRKAIKSGKLPAWFNPGRGGKRTLIKDSDLLAFVEGGLSKWNLMQLLLKTPKTLQYRIQKK